MAFLPENVESTEVYAFLSPILPALSVPSQNNSVDRPRILIQVLQKGARGPLIWATAHSIMDLTGHIDIQEVMYDG